VRKQITFNDEKLAEELPDELTDQLFVEQKDQ
jgi:hypothetical protein